MTTPRFTSRPPRSRLRDAQVRAVSRATRVIAAGAVLATATFGAMAAGTHTASTGTTTTTATAATTATATAAKAAPDTTTSALTTPVSAPGTSSQTPVASSGGS